ncbi:hypothetical protein GTY88_33400 [Streptomyces sp. SID5926]|nr:hypothetical protein [Streptomyces sp. SID5926]
MTRRTGGAGRLTTDTETDAHQQATAAVQAAYGLRPTVSGNPADRADGRTPRTA